MQVVYTAPTRGHHYRYALALEKAGMLHAFVSGFPRLSPRARVDALSHKLQRADLLQTLYIACLKFRAPANLSTYVGYLAKIEQDYSCQKYLDGSDAFVFYNGNGLRSCQYARRKGIITIVEAVNSHVAYQEHILEDEHRRLNIPWTPFLKREKERRMEEYEQADYILTPSEFVKQSFLDLGFPEQKLLKVPYGFDSLSGDSGARDNRDFTVLYVGSIQVRKGVRYLIQAFDKLKHPRKKLVIVGPNDTPNGLEGLSIPPNVEFRGVLKGAELAQAYQMADVFCLPSLEEGLALVLGEALSYGLPIITTTNSGAYDLLTDQKEGFILPIRDANSIYEKLQLLASDPEVYQTMQMAARIKAKHFEGWNATGALLTSTLNNLRVRP